MFPGALPIRRSSETRHPCSRAAHLRSQCAQCARGSARRGVTAGNGDSDTGVSCQRCRRRRPQRRELRSDAGSEGRRGGGRSGVTPGSRGLSGTLRVPARRAARERRSRRARQTPRAFGRAGQALPAPRGAVGALCAPRRRRASLPGRFCPRPRPLRAAARSCPPRVESPPPLRLGKHPERAGAAVTEAPRRVMHGRRAAAR